MIDKDKFWHKEVLPKATAEILNLVPQNEFGSFYLAGGTALAMHLGHRLSRDLDFFSARPFDEERVLSLLKETLKLSVISKDRETLNLNILGIKVSFLGYHYPMLFPFDSYMGVSVADSRDIACMKISAIAGRGSRRDFVDLYALAKIYGLADLLDLFEKKYAEIDFNLVHVLKSLTYFQDAQDEPMPKMLTPISWDEVTEFFRREAPSLV